MSKPLSTAALSARDFPDPGIPAKPTTNFSFVILNPFGNRFGY
jgi:hypothetical protein